MSELGRYFYLDAASYTLDVKSRLALPAKFRTAIHENGFGFFVLTVGDGCLVVYSESEWERILEEEMTPERSGKDDMTLLRYKRFLQNYTKTVETDGQGRIHIPALFLEFAKLSRDVWITSRGNGLELWNKAVLDESIGSVEDFNDIYRRQQINNKTYSIQSRHGATSQTPATPDSPKQG